MTVLAALALVVITQSPAAPASPAPTPSPLATPSPAAAPSPAVALPPPPMPPPTSEEVLAVVKQAPAFAADSRRTGLQADAAKRIPVPGVGDMGYFVEIQWTDKDGAAHTGLAVVAHDTVLDVPWMVKSTPWGLVQVLEDKTLDVAVRDLQRARLAANEAVAVGDIQMIYSAESLFMAVTEGSYGLLRCLNIPADCIAGIPGEKLLEKTLTTATERNGYRRKFHPGARVPSAKAKGRPSPFVKTYAYTAVPVVPGETGTRGFCGDSQGRICVSADGAQPPVAGGLCVTPCTELKP
jgi:hypothetical protein